MKRVLFLAYYFPPIGGGGVQRAVKFCRYLVEFGYQPIVVTGPGKSKDLWTPEDATLAAELPPEVEVHRVPGPEPSGSPKRVGSTDTSTSCLRASVGGSTAPRRSGARSDATSTSFSASSSRTPRPTRRLGSAGTSTAPGLPTSRTRGRSTRCGSTRAACIDARDTARMRRLLATASAIIMNTPEAAKRVRRRFPDLAGRVADAIPNGFDPADFVDIVALERPPGGRSASSTRGPCTPRPA